MFQFRRFPSYTYFVQCTMIRYCRIGFPHSEISGSMRMCRSPKLIAACHVLRRLLMPRHSPCALYSLIYIAVLELCRLHIRFFLRNCNCFTLLKVPQFFGFAICLSVALLLFFSLFSFQGANTSPGDQARMVEISGIEPLTPCLQSRCSTS